ncbi:retrotransposon protein putative unclassified, partial [Trifolium medium]|nr:retrotransposon protein putative unclassified [Trifolium medium]
MEFTWQGQPVTLQGEPGPVSNAVSLLQFQALLHSDTVAGVFTLTTTVPEPSLSATPQPEFPPHLPPSITSVLQRFTSIFMPPTGLPPHRSIDHRIPLME